MKKHNGKGSKERSRAANEMTDRFLSKIGLGRGPKIAAAILFLMGLAPTTAQATCGSYVAIGAHARHQAELTQLPTGPVPEHPLPCSGLFCSRQSESPPATPSIPSTITGLEWILVGPLAQIEGQEPSVYFLERNFASPSETGSRIFHPPRPL
jgi:hypothetical protein